jgi:Cytochrome P450
MLSSLEMVRMPSGTELLIFLPLSVLIYWIVWIIYAKTLHPLSGIPGPFLASISRLWIIQRIHKGDSDLVQRALHRRYGPLVRIAPNEVACADPEAIKTLYPTQSPLTKTDFYPIWGNKTFSKYVDHFSVTDEKLHSERRRVVNHIYTLSNILQSEEYIDQCLLLFGERLGEFSDQGAECDLGEWLQWFVSPALKGLELTQRYRYAFDVVGELFFGEMFGFMRKRKDHESWINSLDTLMPTICTVAVAPSYMRPLIWMSAIFNPQTRKAASALNRIGEAARKCVTERLQRDIEKDQGPSRRDIMQQFLDLKREKGEKVDFGIGEVQLEVYTALYVVSVTIKPLAKISIQVRGIRHNSDCDESSLLLSSEKPRQLQTGTEGD